MTNVINTKTTDIENYRGLRAFLEGNYIGTVISKYDGHNLPDKYVIGMINDFDFDESYIKSEKWVILDNGSQIFPHVIDELDFKPPFDL